MTIIKRKWDFFTKARRESLIREIITYFETKRGEQIGVLAAEDLLDFFLESVSGDIHNRTVENAKSVVKQNFENLEVDLDMLVDK
jgi:uncharacterized protein (DUF2164 family)